MYIMVPSTTQLMREQIEQHVAATRALAKATEDDRRIAVAYWRGGVTMLRKLGLSMGCPVEVETAIDQALIWSGIWQDCLQDVNLPEFQS